jgi:hypothetical protein
LEERIFVGLIVSICNKFLMCELHTWVLIGLGLEQLTFISEIDMRKDSISSQKLTSTDNSCYGRFTFSFQDALRGETFIGQSVHAWISKPQLTTDELERLSVNEKSQS